jgi:hypothetical protein
MILEKEQRLSLAGGQTLVLTRSELRTGALPTEDVLQIVGPQGRPTLVIRVGDHGTSVELAGGPVVLNVDGDRATGSRSRRRATPRLPSPKR